MFASVDRSSAALFSSIDELRLLAFREKTVEEVYKVAKLTTNGGVKRSRIESAFVASIDYVGTTL